MAKAAKERIALPEQPKVEDYTKTVQFLVHELNLSTPALIAATSKAEIPMSAQLVGIVDDSASQIARAIFVVSEQAAEYNKAVQEWSTNVQEIIKEAAKAAGIAEYSVDDATLDAFLNGELKNGTADNG